MTFQYHVLSGSGGEEGVAQGEMFVGRGMRAHRLSQRMPLSL
jgi:hypothetical protein